MSGLAQYDPAAIQQRAAQLWEAGGFFASNPNPERQPFTIVIPPPNVTGALHLGHALNGTLQDTMIRFKRMQGYETLWMPGADHAGIATQAVVEKRLFENERKTRHDIGRDQLVARIWAWKDEYEQRIIAQLRAIGCSCDWRRWRFTLDTGCARAVRHTFYRMFRDRLIFRGKRLVNWDVQLQTAVADDEVYHEEVAGHLWQFKYPVEGTDEFLTVATTRPETMLGDTAVAVHPDDPRYQHLLGKEVRLPLMDRRIPIVADGLLVDPQFGTGVVKVTPAHDPNDYACGLRNKLPMINIMTSDGHINANGGKYQGMARFAARTAVVADIEALGLLAGVTPHRHAVGHSDRSKTPIEPYLSDQWFVRMDELAEKAMAAVREGRVRIHPPRYADTYLQWLGEKRDWCISRQLWWGHQIPIWYCKTCTAEDLQKTFAGRDDVDWVYSEEHQVWLISALEDLSADTVPGHELARDPDVLDTWFSSALWPHSTMGWPQDTPEMRYYYPTSLLSTAREIITLWVARMVLMSEYNLGQVPFHNVFIHPVIQDGNGKPMKKSLGNGVDPFDIIAKYGADGLRYTLVAMSTETQDVRLPVKTEKLEDGRTVNVSEKFELGRNFGTKIFNAAKLILSNLEGYTPGDVPPAARTFEDRWILHRLGNAMNTVTQALESYEFGTVGRALYEFFWGELCDWYLELIKPRLRSESERPECQRVAAFVLDQILRLLHPVMPFLTEEIWQALNTVAPRRGLQAPTDPVAALVVAPWPVADPTWRDDEVAQRMAILQDIIRGVRNTRSQFNVNPKAEVNVFIECSETLAKFLREQQSAIQFLAKVKKVEARPGITRPPQSAAHLISQCQVYVPLAEFIDVGAEIAKQKKKRADLEKRLQSAQAKLNNEAFVANAPPEVVEQHRLAMTDMEQQIVALNGVIAELGE